MKNILVLLMGLVSILAGCSKQQNTKYEITGAGWEQYEGMEMMVSIQDTATNKSLELAKGLIQNGKYKFDVSVDSPVTGLFSISDTAGNFQGWSKGIILEKADLALNLDSKTQISSVKGGKYNTILFTNIESAPEFKKANEEFNSFVKYARSLKKEEIDSTIVKKYESLSKKFESIKQDSYLDLFNSHKEAYVRLFAMQKALEFAEWKKNLNVLAKELGEVSEVINIRNSIKQSEDYLKRRDAVKLGDIAKDFTANDKDGNEKCLAEVLKKNKYVLVEFWASWCAPCRAEIPHMKVAYKNYHTKGFEILSFSVDEKEKAWLKALEKEQMPWINVGDLKGRNSPIAKLYGVVGVPANFLVDQNGKIINMHLRGEALDLRLEELLK